MESELTLYDELIANCIRNNARAQHELYVLFAPAMFKICLRYAPDTSTAQDIFQDAFVKVFQNLHKIKQSSHLPGWIKRVFVYTAIDQLRATAKFRQHVAIDSAVQIENNLYDIQMELATADIMNLVQQLPQRARLVFNLYVMEGFSHKEIAELLSIQEGTSKSQLFEAKKALQKALRNQEKMTS
ncbi:MAG: RNA polymerase sigma factor [Flavobacteriales bacterium]